MSVELIEGITRTNPEVLMSHANASLTPSGRLRLARCVVEQGWPLGRAAGRFCVSVTCAQRRATRYRQHGRPVLSAPLVPTPHHPPDRTTSLSLRIARRWGPARIAYHLGLNISTVGRILTRCGCPRLTFTDPATGTRIRRVRPTRYEHGAPGNLVQRRYQEARPHP